MKLCKKLFGLMCCAAMAFSAGAGAVMPAVAETDPAEPADPPVQSVEIPDESELDGNPALYPAEDPDKDARADQTRHITFDADGEGVTRVGSIEEVTSPDGTKALRVKNPSGAANYLDLGKFEPGTESFSIAFDVCIPEEQSLDSASRTLLTNKDWSSYTNPGFMIGTGTDWKGVTADFSTENNSETFRMRNLPNTDGEWHTLVLTIDREGLMEYYLDDVAYPERSVYIGKLAGKSATTQYNLRAGADAVGKYGTLDTSYDNIRIFSGVLTRQQVAEISLPNVLRTEAASLETVYALAKQQYALTAQQEEAYTSAKAEYAEKAENAISSASAAEMQKLVVALRRAMRILSTDPVEQPLMQFLAVSDIHIDGGSPIGYPEISVARQKLIDYLTASNKIYGEENDATVIAGDFCKNGKDIDFKMFKEYFDMFQGKLDKNVMLALGNHEVMYYTDANGGYSKVAENYQNIVSDQAAGFVKTDKPYYDHWVNGYHFVIMGTEGRGDASAPVVSEEQWAWLEETLNDPENGNNPVFLVVHNPLIGTVTLSDKYHIGTQNDARLKEILKDHKNVIMLSGHNHNGVIDEKALVSNEWGHQVDLPANWQNDVSNQEGSYGTCFKVYKDRTVIESFSYRETRVDYVYTKVIEHDWVTQS